MHSLNCKCIDCQIHRTEQALGAYPLEKSQTFNFAYIFLGLITCFIMIPENVESAIKKINPLSDISTIAIVDLKINDFLISSSIYKF